MKKSKAGSARSVMLKVLSVLSAVVFLLSAAYLVTLAREHRNTVALNNELRGIYHESIEAGEERTFRQVIPNLLFGSALAEESVNPFGDMPVVVDEPIPNDIPQDVAYELQPAFVALRDRNPDTVGWITTGCGVDYPVVWRDNSFYLDHDFDGRSSNAGAIFLDERNSAEMSDDVLLIYGHNMRAGTMFGDLDEYRKFAVLKDAPIIELHSAWEREPRKYVYFSMFDASMTPTDPSYIKITQFNFDTPEAKQAHIDELVNRSMFDLPVDVNADDQLVCLVTCEYTHDDGRYLLYARELRPEETEEDIRAQFAALM